MLFGELFACPEILATSKKLWNIKAIFTVRKSHKSPE
jgi:hypothetical protein